jgi:hypothetical protein
MASDHSGRRRWRDRSATKGAVRTDSVRLQCATGIGHRQSRISRPSHARASSNEGLDSRYGLAPAPRQSRARSGSSAVHRGNPQPKHLLSREAGTRDPLARERSAVPLNSRAGLPSLRRRDQLCAERGRRRRRSSSGRGRAPDSGSPQLVHCSPPPTKRATTPIAAAQRRPVAAPVTRAAALEPRRPSR